MRGEAIIKRFFFVLQNAYVQSTGHADVKLAGGVGHDIYGIDVFFHSRTQNNGNFKFNHNFKTNSNSTVPRLGAKAPRSG